MQCVDQNLKPVTPPRGLDQLKSSTFICHQCERLFKYVSDELYFFADFDATYHRHKDNQFCRAFVVLTDGTVQIGAYDSVEENVIQQALFKLDAKGNLEFANAAAQRFFEAMKRQKRKVNAARIEIRFGK
jgi:hypothetical protein